MYVVPRFPTQPLPADQNQKPLDSLQSDENASDVTARVT